VGKPLMAYLIEPNGLDAADWSIVLAAAVGLLTLAWFRPHLACAVPLWVVTHSLYRLRTFGADHVPRRGGALLISNHVSYVDWLIIWAACRRRVRFVIWSTYFRNPFFGLLLKWVKAIPIDGAAGPKAILRSMGAAAEALRQGDLVLVFPEGRLTRNSFMRPFHRGFEQILKQCPVPLIPVRLENLWGSALSYSGGKIVWKRPRQLLYPVSTIFGPAMPAGTSAAEVRTAIQELSATWAPKSFWWLKPVHRQFIRLAAHRPFRTCYVDTTDPQTPRVLSYAKSAAGAICLANALRPKLAGDKMVGIWLPSTVGSAVTNIAVSLLRKTAVNLNYTAGAKAVASAARQCGLKHVLTSKRFLQRLPLDLTADGVELILLEDVRETITKWQQLRAFLAVVLLPAWLLDGFVLGLRKHSLDDLATVVFSSGSTGEPKGVMLSHRNVAANSESMVTAVDVRPADRLLGILPFFHSFGYTVTLWALLQRGVSCVFHPDPREAQVIGELCRAHRCTIFLATATFLRFLLRRCGPDDFKSVRLLVCGAEKLPPALAREFEAKFGVLPLEGYGCTELSPVVAVNLPDVEVNKLRQVANKMGSVGQPVPGVAVRTVHPETLERLPAGEDGLVIATGANVMVGYLHRPEETRKKVRGGWYDTGDVGRIDPDGFLTLTGRLSRFAKTAGEMVPLERVEEELAAVVQALLGTGDRVVAVVAVPDEKRGERVVVLHTAALAGRVPEANAGLATRGLPNLWLPSDRDFYPVADLPVLGSGKLDLRRVQEMALEVAVRGKRGTS
jgi:acyl-[acyl-carrier-protein]-phospholipid O-acyltransferase/long-chain-fatty-acid--[acyl-carrier-protein] ligase